LNLERFQEELADAGVRLNLALEIDGFSKFADFFFDGIISDWIVQSKIQNASSVCSATLFHDADFGYAEFMASVDAVVMGRKTWEQARTFEDVPFAGKQVIVFSRSQSEANEDRIRFVQGDPSTTIAEIQSSVQKDIWLVGGGDLIQQFITSNLIDEFRLFVHPIILGKGIPLFTPHSRKTNLSFEGSESFPSGLVELRYRHHHHSIENTQNEEI